MYNPTMKTPKQPKPQFEVEDPEAAFKKLESAMKQIMAVPKEAVDAKRREEKKGKR